jgi:hypothetical protein
VQRAVFQYPDSDTITEITVSMFYLSVFADDAIVLINRGRESRFSYRSNVGRFLRNEGVVTLLTTDACAQGALVHAYPGQYA